MTDPPRSGGEPDDPLLRAVARHWDEIKSLASDQQWAQVRAIIAGTAEPDPREALALLADLLWEILPPDHEICEIMRTAVMSSATVDAATADLEMLEQLWRLSERVQPGRAAWRGHHPAEDSVSADTVPTGTGPAGTGPAETVSGDPVEAASTGAGEPGASGYAGDDIDRLIEARLLGLPSLTPQDARQRGINPNDVRLIRLPRPGTAPEFQLPAFQFAPTGDPWDIVMEVNQVLDAADDPWGVMCWWVDPHARLGDAPADLLGRGQDGLIRRAARALAEGY